MEVSRRHRHEVEPEPVRPRQVHAPSAAPATRPRRRPPRGPAGRGAALPSAASARDQLDAVVHALGVGVEHRGLRRRTASRCRSREPEVPLVGERPERRHRRVERAGPVAVRRRAGRSPPARPTAGPDRRSSPAWRSARVEAARGRARPGSAARRRLARRRRSSTSRSRPAATPPRGTSAVAAPCPAPAAATRRRALRGARPAARCSRCRSAPSGAAPVVARPASAIGPLSWRVGSTPVQTTPGRRPASFVRRREDVRRPARHHRLDGPVHVAGVEADHRVHRAGRAQPAGLGRRRPPAHDRRRPAPGRRTRPAPRRRC